MTFYPISIKPHDFSGLVDRLWFDGHRPLSLKGVKWLSTWVSKDVIVLLNYLWDLGLIIKGFQMLFNNMCSGVTSPVKIIVIKTC